jgi:hypothetical protein
MNLCRDPEHPHCTVWVMPGADTCAHGHPQPAALRAAASTPAVPTVAAQPDVVAAPNTRAHFHVSGYDPRAAGGRHAIKLELRGLPAGCPPRLTMLVKSALHLYCPERSLLARSASGEWCPAFLEFSSRGLEHGQHRIELELHGVGESGTRRTWTCSLVILVPRADATLGEIHQAFLSSHKNVRVFADDGSIARVNAQATTGTLDIDVSARNAGIARLDLDATAQGKIDLALPTIAWDEDLVEIDLPLALAHPYPVGAACILNPAPGPEQPRHVRLFAGHEWVLGRFDPGAPEADVLLAHPGEGEAADALTRRISARHALIKAAGDGFTIEDVSRYGVLVDGRWHGRQLAVPLRAGTRIELTASVRGIVTLVVAALLPHALLLRRADGGAAHECFWLVVPERTPAAMPGPGLPLLLHRAGGFWLRNPATRQDTALTPAARLDGACGAAARFAGGPYPETWSVRARVPDRRRGRAAAALPLA